jgi:hypothetical protein
MALRKIVLRKLLAANTWIQSKLVFALMRLGDYGMQDDRARRAYGLDRPERAERERPERVRFEREGKSVDIRADMPQNGR